MYANIIIDISHEKTDRTFQYVIPKELEESIRPGVCVNIPFGKGDTLRTGYVIEVTDKAEYDVSRLKSIDGLAQNAVAIEGQLIELAAYIRERFGGTMNQALRTVLPVKHKTKEKKRRTIRLNVSQEEALQALALFDQKNSKARARLLGALIKEPSIPYELATQKLNITASVIRALTQRSLIRVEEELTYRNPIHADGSTETGADKESRPPVVLNEEQQKIVDDILKRKADGDVRPSLIHGVTGSGKTEVYIELIAHAVANGQQAIVLIPEIALTYQTVMRFYHRFGDRVSILNSRMSQGERYDQYERAKSGKLDVIIGPRSALFAPFANLGFIIIDEEHEDTYQSETIPRYDARGAAKKRCEMTGALLILGSATPSLSSYYRAENEIYQLYRLQTRAKSSKMAQVEVVDMRDELQMGNRSMFSERLTESIKDRLQKDEQVMLFINRRGINGFLSCRSCGHVLKCPHCDVSLSEHKNGQMVCHYCGYTTAAVKQCPECGSGYIGGFKAGTQKVEELLHEQFPQAKILRMDADTTKKKDSHEQILSAFANQEAQILVGTQMIVKGHDFPNVTLVGVLAADLSLYAGDYRSAEKTFQLLTQAAGRAGRGKIPGEAIIQTYNPQHYAIVAAAKQSYEDFYKEEVIYRQMLKYPPIWNMMVILVSSTKEELAEKVIQGMYAWLKREQIHHLALVGPAKPAVAKVNDRYRDVLYLKQDDIHVLIQIKDEMERRLTEHPVKEISVQFDIR